MQTNKFYQSCQDIRATPIVILSFYLLLAGLASCGSLGQSGFNGIIFKPGINVTSIRELKQQRDNQSTIYIQGKVAKLVPLLDRQAYQLQDSSGKIAVITNKTNLQVEDKVLIKGNVRYQSIPIAGRDLGEVYVEEQEQIERIPAQ